jgi:murein DD-endopeptidase MepM/ murein hydrolase activator NlpD
MFTFPYIHIRRLRRALAFAVVLSLALGPAGVSARDTEDPSGRGLVRTLLALPLDLVRKTSGFATRRHPIRKTVHFHAGVDFAAPHGTPVRSVDDGRIAFAGTQNGYGKVVYIEHAGGHRTTVYAHLSRMDVRAGDIVRTEQTIGAVGNTGLSTGPHLHFEVREGGKPIDPMRWAGRFDDQPEVVRAGLFTAAISTPVVGTLGAPVDGARCLELLQKFSLEALAPDELDLLRRGCAE